MKVFRIIAGLVVCSLLFVVGCGGSGSAGKVGTINVTGSTTSSTDTTSNVAFTITYTNPYAISVGGLEYSYSVYLDGVPQGTFTDNMNDNGTNTFTETISFPIDKTASAQTVRFVASTDNLKSSDSVTVAALGTLEITPLSATFAATDAIGSTKTFTVSGGVKPYVFAVTPAGQLLVTEVHGTDSITLTRVSAGAGSVTIEVTDSSLPVAKVTAQATLVAIPAPPAP
jgi:hypothetical protein